MPEWLNIVYRSIASILFLFFLTKLIGKRQLSQMTFFEYTVGIAIGEIAGFMATDMNGSMFHGFLALCIYALFPIVLGWLALKSKKVRNVVEGKATLLIKNGKILEDNLKKERITTDELLEQLRLKNAFKVADVEFALMEPNGDVSVLLKAQNQPLTPKHLQLKLVPESEPQAVIMDGEIMDEALSTIGLNRQWLQTELEKAGVALENVFLGQVDSNGELFVDLFDDNLTPPPAQTLNMTYVTLKKCQADLELFALGTKDRSMKHIYGDHAKQLQTLLQELKRTMSP